ncbi:MAG: hypothetical protein ABII68_01440 [Pseudomonadota bacterium]
MTADYGKQCFEGQMLSEQLTLKAPQFFKKKVIMSESQLNYSMFNTPEAVLENFNHIYVQFADATEAACFYFETLTEFIESQEKKNVQRLEGVAKNLPNSRKSEFWAYNYPCYWKDIFEENLKASFVVSLLSTLEFYLKCVCQILHDGKMKELAKYKGNFPDKVKNYLNHCIPENLSVLDWDTIYRLWRIRNVIAHNQGLCSSDRDKKLLEQFVDENDGISMRNGWIQIESVFCKRALIKVTEFGLSLGDIIRTNLTNR